MAWLTAITVLPSLGACWLVAWFTGFSPAVALLALGLAPVVHAPFTLLGGRLLFGDVSALESLWATLRLLPFVAVVCVVDAALSVSVCFGLGLLAWPGLVYLPETLLLERVGFGRAVQRSARLASGQVGVAIMAVAARWGLAVWGALVAELSGQLLVGFVLQLGTPFGQLMEGTLTPFVLAGILLSHPLYALFRLLLYVDVRTRMEGWDLQVGLRALGLSASGEGEA